MGYRVGFRGLGAAQRVSLALRGVMVMHAVWSERAFDWRWWSIFAYKANFVMYQVALPSVVPTRHCCWAGLHFTRAARQLYKQLFRATLKLFFLAGSRVMQCATTSRVISPAPPIDISLASAHSRLAVCSSPQQSRRRGHDEVRRGEGAACARSLVEVYFSTPLVSLPSFSRLFHLSLP
jgi:hypothetical protein